MWEARKDGFYPIFDGEYIDISRGEEYEGEGDISVRNKDNEDYDAFIVLDRKNKTSSFDIYLEEFFYDSDFPQYLYLGEIIVNNNESKDFIVRLNMFKKISQISNRKWKDIYTSYMKSLLRYFKLLAQEQKCCASYFLAREISADTSDIEICIHIIQSILRNIPFKSFEKNSKRD